MNKKTTEEQLADARRVLIDLECSRAQLIKDLAALDNRIAEQKALANSLCDRLIWEMQEPGYFK